VLIENVAFGCEDEYPVLFHGDMITSAATPPKLAAASDTNARSIPSIPSMDRP
jgi:hypothetical protein